ncbi:uncharacterized protein DUF4178 [Couchioplanes caeruleus]|uniref:Uncharacterized protein DUF4178 n=1 Tax=Couchioplanes caeruleus TaxID=56438 RepID=A0A3N1GTG3_9ACTN|nr:uncharacterized protein DUF4178 [Couchioplanes caeruleus]
MDMALLHQLSPGTQVGMHETRWTVRTRLLACDDVDEWGEYLLGNGRAGMWLALEPGPDGLRASSWVRQPFTADEYDPARGRLRDTALTETARGRAAYRADGDLGVVPGAAARGHLHYVEYRTDSGVHVAAERLALDAPWLIGVDCMLTMTDLRLLSKASP